MEERVVRPWGSYVVVFANNYAKVKVITINPHSRLSLQRHKHRMETWYILDGVADVTLGDYTFKATVGEKVFVPYMTVHRIGAREESVRFVEVQGGSYFGEDDIERFDDDYGRVEGENSPS